MSVGGYRITESGDARVLETSSDLRVTENLYAVDAALTASSSYDFVPTVRATTASTVAASGTLAAVAQVKRYAAILVANSSSITASIDRTTQGATSLTATGSISSVATYNANAASGLSGAGTIALDDRVVKYAAVGSGLVSFIRSPESDYEDIRITEGSDTRITELIETNIIEGTMIADATKIPFSSTWYVKRSGTWQTMSALRVKRSGAWITPLKLNHKLNTGIWKRIY